MRREVVKNMKLGYLKNLHHEALPVLSLSRQVINIAAPGSNNKNPALCPHTVFMGLHDCHSKHRLFPYTALSTVFTVKLHHSNTFYISSYFHTKPGDGPVGPKHVTC
jgi:hypothetical protein